MRSISLLLALFAALFVISADAQPKSKPQQTKAAKSLNVLFIGNSFTAYPRGAFKELLAASPYKNSKFQYICPGGCTLTRHLENPEVIEKIKGGNWDYVVLQEQSQTPGLPSTKPAFVTASKELCKIIKESGATPLLYVTWGHRDGDKRNPELYPDYTTMQTKLTTSYLEVAKENEVGFVPVGQVWEKTREALKENYTMLYHKDGKHSSDYGNFLIACTFMKHLFKSDLSFVKPTDETKKLIKDMVLQHP